MARSKQRKKKKKFVPPVFSLKPENIIVKRARLFPIYECHMTELGQEGGKTQVTVARRMPNGNIIMGFYLVDLWCLGVKDSYFRIDVPVPDYQDFIEGMKERAGLIKIEPAIAFNTVYAGVEYAEDLGFEPAKDFNISQYLLDDPDTIEYIEIETGLNGKPAYYPGPDDKVEAIRKKLDQKLGKGNYLFFDFNEDDFEDDGFAMSRQEVMTRYFPQEKVDKKIQSLFDEDEKTVFMLQTVIAMLALEMANGSVTDLIKLMDDEEFLVELIEEVEDAVNEMREEEGLPPVDPDTPSGIENMTILLLDRIKRHGGVDFMFEDKYKPLPEKMDLENLDNLSPEVMKVLVEEAFTMLSDEDKLMVEVSPFFMEEMENIAGNNFDAADVTEEMRKQIINGVKLKIRNDEELNEIMEESVDFDSFLEMALDRVIETWQPD